MRKIIKKISLIIFTLIFTFSNIANVFASSASISVSSSASTVVVGNTFTVTITIKSSTYFGTWEFTPSYDKARFTMTSGSASVVGYGKVKEKSFTYKFKAISAGSGTITVKSAAVRDYDTTQEMSLSKGSKTIKVITKSQLEATYSKNNNLKSLSIDGLTLSPAFNKNTTSYKTTADPNATSINIRAAVEDSKSSLAGTGTKAVNEGANTFNIVVTAQNGSKKTYTIVVDVLDPNPIEVTIGEKKYVVVKRESNIPQVENFTKSTTDINEQHIPTLYNETNDFTLVGLKDEENNIALFLYNKETNDYTLYEDAKLTQMNIFPLELEETYKPENERTKITIDDVTFDAIKISASGLYILKARDLTTADESYYEYDEKTNTLIRYVEEEDPRDAEIIKYKKMIIVLSAESLVVILLLIIILIRKMKKNKIKKRRIEEERKRLEEEKRKQEEKQVEEIKQEEIKEEVKEEKKKIEKEKNSKKHSKKKEVNKDDKGKKNS